MEIDKSLALKIAQAVCGLDHLTCSWPDCGCKSTKRKINAVVQVVAEAVPQMELVALSAGRVDDD